MSSELLNVDFGKVFGRGEIEVPKRVETEGIVNEIISAFLIVDESMQNPKSYNFVATSIGSKLILVNRNVAVKNYETAIYLLGDILNGVNDKSVLIKWFYAIEKFSEWGILGNIVNLQGKQGYNLNSVIFDFNDGVLDRSILNPSNYTISSHISKIYFDELNKFIKLKNFNEVISVVGTLLMYSKKSDIKIKLFQMLKIICERVILENKTGGFDFNRKVA